MDPGTSPRKASHQLSPSRSTRCPSVAASASQVAPLTPSALVWAATQTLFPEISAG